MELNEYQIRPLNSGKPIYDPRISCGAKSPAGDANPNSNWASRPTCMPSCFASYKLLIQMPKPKCLPVLVRVVVRCGNTWNATKDALPMAINSEIYFVERTNMKANAERRPFASATWREATRICQHRVCAAGWCDFATMIHESCFCEVSQAAPTRLMVKEGQEPLNTDKRHTGYINITLSHCELPPGWMPFPCSAIRSICSRIKPTTTTKR